MRFLALVTRFSQTGLHVSLVNRLLNLQAGSRLRLEEALGPTPARLVILAENRIKLMHPLFAEELLRQELGDIGNGIDPEGLQDLSIELIGEVERLLGGQHRGGASPPHPAVHHSDQDLRDGR